MFRTEVDIQTGEVKTVDLTPAEIAAAKDLRTYAELRAAEYPPFADYLDGVVKNDQAQIAAYVQACLTVKAKYPKPNA